MANTVALAGAHVQQSHASFSNTHPLSWIKRRARRIEQYYRIERREALCNAVLDFFAFNPAVAK
jgi:hypothetical protein